MVTTAGTALAVAVIAGAMAAALAAGTADPPAPGAAVETAGLETAAVASDAGPPGVGLEGRYVRPLAGTPAVVHAYVAPAAAWASGHRGVDLAGEIGTAVLAPADGTVAFAGTVVDRGVVTLAHPDGLRSSLEPVAWAVVAGERVQRGQQVGTIQAVQGHCAPAGCLHWGVRRRTSYLDPLTLLDGAGPVVLLPGR